MTKGEGGQPGVPSDLAAALSLTTARGMCDNLGDTRELLQDLIGYGCPIVLCTPLSDYNPGERRADLRHPARWETAEPDPAVVDAYTSGLHTPALVSGHILDAIDVDTKNGADLQAIIRSLDDHGVVVVGADCTPSGGAHLFVAATGICTSNKPVNGVDFRGGSSDGSGRGLIYLPGANRPKYPGKDYLVGQAIDWDAVEHVDVDQQREAIWSFLQSVGIKPALSRNTAAATVVAEPLPENLPADLVEKIEDLDAAPVGARSERFFHLVGECYRRGLTQGQTVSALTPWCATVDKYVGRVESQVAECWPKILKSDVNAWLDESAAANATLWESRPWLKHIHTFARSRRVAPLALLGVYLVRIAANTPPWVTLPPLVGGKGSLNLFCALVGPSGAGKGAAVAASDELMPWADHWDHPGSGEGLLHLFVARQPIDDPDNPGRKITALQQHTYRRSLLVDEIDTLTALGTRQGANLLPTLRTMWNGTDVGFAYADPSKRLNLDAHTYRVGLVVGAQPERCAGLFDDADGGTPQRFIWTPLTDPDAPDMAPADPGALAAPMHWTGAAQQINVPEEVADTLSAQRLAVLRSGDTGGLDGHASLNRLKIAAVFAISDGRLDMTVDDWALAGKIQSISDATRTWIQHRLSHAAQQQQEQRTKARTKQAVAVDEAVDDSKVRRAARVIGNRVHRGGGEPVSQNEARKALSSGNRDYFDPGLDLAIRVGWVVVDKRAHPRTGEIHEVLLPGEVTP